MRSMRAVRRLQCSKRPSHVTHAAALRIKRYGYCSSCQSRPVSHTKTTATSTENPPIPPADHRQLGVEQELFTTSIYSPGSPLFLPNGSRIFNKLVQFLRAQYEYFGFQEVISPTIYKKSLWQKSGHWENYADDMFSVKGRGASGETEGRQIGEDEEFGLKPMNCPGHCILFASKPRSFRDLPIRYADFSPLHRNEISGALSGLTRVRRFHQDDGHIFCRPSQVGEEISKTLDFVRLTYQTFGLGPYRLALSTRPKDHYIGTEADWNTAEAALRTALDDSGQVWTVNEGDGAFYGPKIDIILKDSDGKEHQTATIQLDFQLPKRFSLEYTASAPELEQKGVTTTDPSLLAESGPVRPVMIHRAILGSVERFMALLIEHYNGRWPFWLNPKQVMIVTVNDSKEVVDYASWARDQIQGGGLHAWLRRPSTADTDAEEGDGIRASNGESRPREIGRSFFAVDIDDSARSVKKKISEAKRHRYSVIVVVGRNNVERTTITVDLRGVSESQNVIGRELNMLKQLTGGEKGTDPKRRLHSPPDGQAKTDPINPNSHSEWSPEELKEVEVEPWRLREMLLYLERAYQ